MLEYKDACVEIIISRSNCELSGGNRSINRSYRILLITFPLRKPFTELYSYCPSVNLEDFLSLNFFCFQLKILLAISLTQVLA